MHQARSRETRDRLLIAAQDVFAARGYEGTRIADIAAAADCSVGALYLRFKDKETLFGAIVESFVDGAPESTAAVMAERDRLLPAELLRRFIHVAASHLAGYRGLVRAILERGFGQPHLLAPLMSMRAEIHDGLSAIVRNGQPKKGKPSELTINVVTQMIYGFILNSIVNPMALTSAASKPALDELADIAIGHLKLGKAS